MKLSSLFNITSILACISQLISYCYCTNLFREVRSSTYCQPLKGRPKRDIECTGLMEYITYNNTDSLCECPPFAIYFPDSNSCYRVYRRGLCPEQHYVYMGLNDTEPSCVKDPCKNGFSFKGGCYKLYDSTVCPDDMVLGIDMVSLQITCMSRERSTLMTFWNPRMQAIIPKDFYSTCRRGTKGDRCGFCRVKLTD